MFVILCAVILSCADLASSNPFHHLNKRIFSPPAPGDHTCNATMYNGIEECYGPMNVLDKLQDPRALRPTNAEVEQFCSSVRRDNRCFMNRMRTCKAAGVAIADVVTGVLTYVCEEGLNVLINEGDCWQHEALQGDIVFCTEEMERNFKKVGYFGLCRELKKFIVCLGDKISSKTVCSIEAARFVQGVARASLRPAARVLRCNLHSRILRDLAHYLTRR